MEIAARRFNDGTRTSPSSNTNYRLDAFFVVASSSSTPLVGSRPPRETSPRRLIFSLRARAFIFVLVIVFVFVFVLVFVFAFVFVSTFVFVISPRGALRSFVLPPSSLPRARLSRRRLPSPSG